MNYWIILILSVVAMVAIVLAFMWWWTTENWDWASAELKPPRTVPQETEGRPLSWAEAEELKWKGRVADGLNDLTLQQLPSLEQRVTALEEGQEDLERGAHSLILTHIKAWHSPSRATESHIKGDPLGVERDSTTLPTLRFSQSDPPIIKGGHAERLSEFAEPEDA